MSRPSPIGSNPRLTASQLYLQKVTRNELAQMSIEDLHRQQNFEANALASTDTLTPAKPTKRHDGASYTALGIEESDSEEDDEDDNGLLEDGEHSAARSNPNQRKPRVVEKLTLVGKVHRAIDEWVHSAKETFQRSRRAQVLGIVSVLLLAIAFVGLASQRSSWRSKTSGDNQTDTVSDDLVPVPSDASPSVPVPSNTAAVQAQQEGQGLLDLRPGEVGTWYKSMPGAMATGALPFWASAAAQQTVVASHTKGHQVIQTAVAADETAQKLAPFNHMGPLTPYKSSPGFGVDNLKYRDALTLVPNDKGKGTCSVDQVHILHRHGSRYPTSGSPVHAVEKVAQARLAGHVEFSGPLAFLQQWSYELGGELLVPPGRLELFHSGVQAHMQYAHLVGDQYNGLAGHTAALQDTQRRNKLVPVRSAASRNHRRQWGWGTSSSSPVVVRAGSQRRIVDSALSWLQGFYGPQLWNDFAVPPEMDLADQRGLVRRSLGGSSKGHNARVDLQVHPEGQGWNTTLASNFACPAANGHNATTATTLQSFQDTYLAKAVARLQPYIKVLGTSTTEGEWDGKLTPALLNGMQQACSYETVALGQSSFCSLFTAQEWKDYEHLWDLKFHGTFGAGTPLGAAQGVGWVNELVARLTNQAWNDLTQTSENMTVNLDPKRFPTDSTQRLFADFTHDSTLTAVLAALGLKQLNTLPSASTLGQEQEHQARFRTSHLVPFGARMVFERLSCGMEQKPFVRVILNDAVVPLSDVGCTDRPDGICPLDEFLRAIQDRNQRANYHGVCGTWNPALGTTAAQASSI